MSTYPLGYLTKEQCTFYGYPPEENEQPVSYIHKNQQKVPVYDRCFIKEKLSFFKLGEELPPIGYFSYHVCDVLNISLKDRKPDAYFEYHNGYQHCVLFLYDVRQNDEFQNKEIYQKPPNAILDESNCNRLKCPRKKNEKPFGFQINYFFYQEKRALSQFVIPLFDRRSDPRWRLKLLLDPNYDPRIDTTL